MNEVLSIGLVFILAFLAQKLLLKIKLPRVTAYLILGIILGPFVANLISSKILGITGLVSEVALGVIAFSIGQNFSINNLKKIGKPVFVISIFVVLITWLLIFVVMFFALRQPLHISLILGAISTATAPAATVMVIREYKARGSFTNLLLSVVAIDDAWGIIVFAICFALSRSIIGEASASVLKVVGISFIEIFIAIALGVFLSIVLSFFSKFVKTQDELLIFILGFLFLGIGLSKLLGVSVLLLNMALGAGVVNFGKMGRRFFNIIETVDSPLFLLFFILAGASLEIPALMGIGLIGLVYLIVRIIGRLIGSYTGSSIINTSPIIKRYLGLGLIPQAGVALGMAIYTSSYLPEIGKLITSVIIGTTIIYEIFGPLCTKFALYKAGEIK